MSLDALQKEIEKKGKEEARSAEDIAHKEASLILDEAKKHSKKVNDEAKEWIRHEIKRLQNEYSANSELARNTVLVGAKDSVVDEVFAKARKDIIEQIRKKQNRIFDQAAKAAKELGPIEKMRYIVNKKDAQLVKQWKGRVEFSNIIGGVIIYSEDEKVKIDASIDTMLENSSESIKAIISDAIYHARKLGGSTKKTASKAISKKPGKKQHAKKANITKKGKKVVKASSKRKR